MNKQQSPSLAQDYEAAIEWWQLAGVDTDYADDATDWLAAPEAEAEPAQRPAPAHKPAAKPDPAPSVPRVAIGGDKSGWPQSLEEFQRWWLESGTLDAGGSYPRVAPRRSVGGSGDSSAGSSAGTALMVIVPEPEEADRETLLSGPEGRLLAGFLAAAGIAPGSTYIASTLPRHTPLPDWGQLKADGVGDLLAHHIALAAPNRILAFGRNILPLLGHDTAQGAAILRDFNHDGGSVPVMGAATLGELLRSAGRRKQFWHRWLDWTEG